MAKNFRRKQLGNRTDVPKGTGPDVIFGRGIRTRKYIDRQYIDDPEEGLSNADHIVRSSANLKPLAIAIESIAAQARESIDQIKDVLNGTAQNPQGTTNTAGVKLTERDVRSFEDVFSRDSISRISANTDELQKRAVSLVDDVVKFGGASGFSKRGDVPIPVNRAQPIIDYISLGFGKRGTSDKSYARIVFSVSHETFKNEKVKAFRIFRADRGKAKNSNGTMSIRGLGELVSSAVRTHSKNDPALSYLANRFSENGIDNTLSLTTRVDEFTGIRIGLSQTESSSSSNLPVVFEKSSDEGTLSLLEQYTSVRMNVDYSVVNDLNSLRNIQIQNRTSPAVGTIQESLGRTLSADVQGKMNLQQILNLRQKESSASDSTLKFKEIMSISVDKSRNRLMPGFIEFETFDDSVEVGRQYTYYVVSVDEDMVESVRSRLTDFSVTSEIPPDPPSGLNGKVDGPYVVLSITAGVERIEKFEIYRREVDNAVSTDPMRINTAGGPSGFLLSIDIRDVLKNGFVQVGEVLNSRFGGAYFRDISVVQGKTYDYRVYSVDIYGNKSQDSKEFRVFVNERSKRNRDLKKPTILSEIDFSTNYAKVTIIPTDPRVVGFFLARRDLSLNESAFTVPTEPSHIKFGSRNSKIFDGTVLRSKDSAWTGFISNDSSTVVFVDKTSRIDHIYQYSVYGVDRFGNATSHSLSSPLFISRRAQVNEPINLRSSVTNVSGAVSLKIEWDDGAIDVEPEEKLGNQEDVENTSVRTLYQVERRLSTNDFWESFPLTEQRYLEDTSGTKGQQRQTFMPPFLRVDSSYLYRVAAYQTGGFISNFSKTIQVDAFLPILSPKNFRIQSCDVKCNPHYVTLTWDDAVDSGVIDRWIIDRAVVNNFAATRLNISNPESLKNLKFERLAKVSRESSRGRSRSFDESSNKRLAIPGLGQHRFIDRNVVFGNSYYYRITAVGLNKDNRSKPVYRGIKVADQIFDDKLNLSLTQREKNRLAFRIEPLGLIRSLKRR